MDELDRLEKIRRENAERRKTLQSLQTQCNEASTTDTITAANQSTALNVELEMLQSITQTNRELNLNFPQELVASHDDLRQTNAVLERSLKRQGQKLDAMQQTISQHKAVQESLKSLQSISDQQSNDDNGQDSSDAQRENEWIRDELQYACSQIQETRQRKRRRLEDTNEGSGYSSSRLTESLPWSLDQLVLESTKRYLTSSSDPYLLVSTLPVEDWKVDLLRQCNVLQSHPDNPDLVCLSNYNGNT